MFFWYSVIKYFWCTHVRIFRHLEVFSNLNWYTVWILSWDDELDTIDFYIVVINFLYWKMVKNLHLIDEIVIGRLFSESCDFSLFLVFDLIWIFVYVFFKYPDKKNVVLHLYGRLMIFILEDCGWEMLWCLSDLKMSWGHKVFVLTCFLIVLWRWQLSFTHS